MPDVSWTANIRVSGGTTTVVSADAVASEAIDMVEVEVPAGATDTTIDIQPGEAAAIHLFMIKSSVYGADLSYKAKDDSAESAEVGLDGPHLFTAGSIALFGCDLHQLVFSNQGSKDATVRVFIARDATS